MIGGEEEEGERQEKDLPQQQQQQQQQEEDARSNMDAAALPIGRAQKVSPAPAPATTVVAPAAAEESPLKEQDEDEDDRQQPQCNEGKKEGKRDLQDGQLVEKRNAEEKREDEEEDEEDDNVEQQKMPKTGLALTEYTARPSRLSADMTKSKAASLLPKDFLLPDGYPDYLRLILTSRVYEVLDETPLTHAVNLSNRYERKIMLKREDLLPVFSFKLRGAYNKMAHLDPNERWKGVVACSAGNHAQGVVYSARKLKIPATIVMPVGTPSIKHLNVARLGGTVVLHGADFDAAKEEAQRLEQLHGLTNIAPFDDPYVIAGQGTIGMELLRQTPLQHLEAVFCCVGGGGLIAGVGVYLKRLAPHIKVIGVEAHDASAMAQSLRAGRRVLLPDVGLFADGAAVRTVGRETFRLCREVVDDVILVSTDETCAAIKDVFEDTRSVVEPAGALALAGLKKYAATHPPAHPASTLVAIASGANMDFERLRFVAERAAIGERKEALLLVTCPERPGAFAELVKCVLPHAVTELSYRYADPDTARIMLGISLYARERERELAALLARIRRGGSSSSSISGKSASSGIGVSGSGDNNNNNNQNGNVTTDGVDGNASNNNSNSSNSSNSSGGGGSDGSGSMSAQDISDDELAKTHLRHLVGGRAALPDERLYSFRFPERPGALAKFLTLLRPGLVISLFHYRSQGGDVARVLAGIQCPPAQRAPLERFLRELGYPWREETDNAVYQAFMRS